MLSYLLAFAGALANATGNVLNRKAARDEPAQVQFRLRMFADLLRRPAWLAAIGLMTVSFIFAAAALGTGQLASVQLVVILELPLTLIGGSLLLGSRLGWTEWAAVAAMTGGVIGLLFILDPHEGPTPTVPALLWILASAANGGAIVVLFLAAKARRHALTQATLLGLAAGFSYGLTAAYTKGMADDFNEGGISAVISSWQLYACVTAGLVAVWLLQNAYQAGPLTAAQPGITLVDPVVSTLWGVLVFGEHVRQGAVLWLTALPLIAVAAGVFVLSRSPVLHATANGPDGPPAGRRPADMARADS
jgi:drug/metabolite transporter (DMT)-like permease